MRVFIKNKNDSIEIFQDEEIIFGRICDGYTQPMTSELSNCFDSGCYSLDNSESGFLEELIEAIQEKFSIKISLEHYIDNAQELVSLIREKNSKIEEKNLSNFIEKWIQENEQHTEEEFFYTGEGNSIELIDNNYQEITGDKEGIEIIKDFKRSTHETTKTGDLLTGWYYKFYSSRYAGEQAGYSVEKYWSEKGQKEI